MKPGHHALFTLELYTRILRAPIRPYATSVAMDKKQDSLHRRPLYLYDLPDEVLSTIVIKAGGEAQEGTLPASPREQPPAPVAESALGSQACSLCGLAFASVLDQRSHLRSDFHTYNLKQKLRGSKAVTEAEFEKLVEDLDESLSGSGSVRVGRRRGRRCQKGHHSDGAASRSKLRSRRGKALLPTRMTATLRQRRNRRQARRR